MIVALLYPPLQSFPPSPSRVASVFLAAARQVYIPAMKQFVLEFKNLAGQQQGVASITTARESNRNNPESR